MDYEFDLEW